MNIINVGRRVALGGGGQAFSRVRVTTVRSSAFRRGYTTSPALYLTGSSSSRLSPEDSAKAQAALSRRVIPAVSWGTWLIQTGVMAKKVLVGEEGLKPAEAAERTLARDTLVDVSAEVPISCAAVALLVVQPFFDLMGELQAGKIGTHYSTEIRDLLKLPPTNENLRNMAVIETKFWNTDRGSFLGRRLSAQDRYDMLIEARDGIWLNSMDRETQERVALVIYPEQGNGPTVEDTIKAAAKKEKQSQFDE